MARAVWRRLPFRGLSVMVGYAMVGLMMPATQATAAPWTFAGLHLSAGCVASGCTAARWRAEGGEWVRPVIGPGAWRSEWPDGEPPLAQWAVDFPPGADERAVVEAGSAGRSFQRSGGRIARRGNGAELRIALAKNDRYLAAPVGAGPARWRWVSADVLPCGALVVVARDDDFLAGVLASRWLDLWQQGLRRRFDVIAVRCFPLPWSPETPRGALTLEQEERRNAVVQAWRGVGAGIEDFDPESWALEDLNTAVAAAYGWPASIESGEALARLNAMALG